MGKKDNRTKGNTKPSSSARSAQLLGENAGFVGFGTSVETAFVPLIPDADDGVPSSFRLVLRKMLKKDVTTKVKALQEFLDLAKEATSEDMLAVLPYWPSVYTKLAGDGDRRVRELSHSSLGAVVSSVGKHLAPHLKAMAGVWFLGQCDPHLPAASSATAAWNSAFPPDKQAGAVAFCQKEILAHIIENLTRATPQSLSDPKVTPAEEMEARYVRTLAVSLTSYSRLLSCVPHQDAALHAELLDNVKFVKLAKYKVVGVREAWFSAVASLSTALPACVVDRASVLVPAVLGNLNETGGTMATSAVWTAALHLLRLIPTAWALTNPQKAVFPGLFKHLSSAGSGAASVTLPSLLPFLSMLPLTVMGDHQKFISRWFDSLRDSLALEKLKILPREYNAVVGAIVDCAVYFLQLPDLEIGIKQDLVKNQLLGLVKLCLEDKKLSQSCLCSSLAVYLEVWEKGRHKEHINQVNKLFWSGMRKLSLATIEDGENTSDLISMMLKLKSPKAVKSESKEKNLLELRLIVSDLCSVLSKNLLEDKDIATSSQYLAQLVAHFGLSAMGDDANHIDFLKSRVTPLFAKKEYDSPLSQLTWAIASQLSEPKGVECLEQVLPVIRPELVQQILLAAGPRAHQLPVIQSWLTSQPMQDELLIYARIITGSMLEDKTKALTTATKPPDIWAVLASVLGSGVIMPEGFRQQLLGVFRTGLEVAMTAVHDASLVQQLEFVCDLLLLLMKGEGDCPGQEIVYILFTLDTLVWSKPELQNKLNKSWLMGVNMIKYGDVHEKMAEYIRVKLVEELDVDSVQSLAKMAADLLASVQCKEEEGGNKWSNNVIELLLKMIPKEEGWTGLDLDNRALYRSYLTMEHASCISPLPEVLEDGGLDAKMLKQPMTALFLVSTIQMFSLPKSGDKSIEKVLDKMSLTEEEKMEFPCEVLSKLNHVILAVAYSQELISYIGEDLNSSLIAKTTSILQIMCKNNLDVLLSSMISESNAKGGIWSLALAWFYTYTYSISPQHTEVIIIPSLKAALDRQTEQQLENVYPGGDAWIDSTLNTATVIIEQAAIKDQSQFLNNQLFIEIGRFLSVGVSGPGGLASLHLINKCLQVKVNEDWTDELLAVLESIAVWRKQEEDQLLYGKDLSLVTWSRASTVAAVVNFFAILVEKLPSVLTETTWDMVTCSLVSWCSSLEESKEGLNTSPSAVLVAVAVGNLVRVTSQVMADSVKDRPALTPIMTEKKIENETLQRVSVSPPAVEKERKFEEAKLPPNLREEWKEFFCQGVFNVLVPVFLNISSSPSSHISGFLSSSIGGAVSHCPPSILLSTPLPPLYLVQDMDSPPLPDNITFIFNHFCPHLLSPSRHIQVTVAHLLASTAEALTSAEDSNSSDDDEERELPRRLVEVLTRGEKVLETVLAEFTVGETAGDIPPGNDTFIVVTGYLLAWKVILRLVELASPELRPKYSEYLRSKGHIDHLLNHLFRLIPGPTSPHLDSIFVPPPLLVSSPPSSSEIQTLSGSCWLGVCQHLPALARGWFGALDRAASQHVEKITSQVVTPRLWKEEATAIEAAKASDNMTLRVRPSVREVVATYTIDEGSMELVVALPGNHPLGGLSVESGKRVGVETGQWRKWMLQLTTFLTHQNGSILDGLSVWKRNVDKRFEGVEECYICFYILHGSNHQLPKLGCRTCKKKFHSACLYKWFSTSNNSTCPLCRNLF